MSIIARLAGTFAGTDGQAVIIDVGGVGYAVVVSDFDRTVIAARGIRCHVVMLTRHIVREDRQVLYGFVADKPDWPAWAEDSRAVFDAVCEVQGCGGSTAMRLLSIMIPERALGFLDGVGMVEDGKGMGKVTAAKLFGCRRPKPKAVKP